MTTMLKVLLEINIYNVSTKLIYSYYHVFNSLIVLWVNQNKCMYIVQNWQSTNIFISNHLKEFTVSFKLKLKITNSKYTYEIKLESL